MWSYPQARRQQKATRVVSCCCVLMYCHVTKASRALLAVTEAASSCTGRADLTAELLPVGAARSCLPSALNAALRLRACLHTGQPLPSARAMQQEESGQLLVTQDRLSCGLSSNG